MESWTAKRTVLIITEYLLYNTKTSLLDHHFQTEKYGASKGNRHDEITTNTLFLASVWKAKPILRENYRERFDGEMEK